MQLGEETRNFFDLVKKGTAFFTYCVSTFEVLTNIDYLGQNVFDSGILLNQKKKKNFLVFNTVNQKKKVDLSKALLKKPKKVQ